MKVGSPLALSAVILFFSARNTLAQEDGDASTSVVCDPISTCACEGCGDDVWLVGNSINTPEECQAWCKSSEVCGTDSGLEFTCGVPLDEKYSTEGACMVPGQCICTSDVCTDKPITTAYANSECSLKCEQECEKGGGYSYTCDGETLPPVSAASNVDTTMTVAAFVLVLPVMLR